MVKNEIFVTICGSILSRVVTYRFLVPAEFQKYVMENGEPVAVSGEQEHYESMLNYYV